MRIPFQKYQATGNDFVIVDNRNGHLFFAKEQIEKICDRKYGVGADGLMLIEKHPALDFNLVYYNRDGSPSLCGNGSRAAVNMAFWLGIIQHHTKFNAYDGEHEASVLANGNVRLKMNNVKEMNRDNDSIFINTGSPHHIQFVTEVDEVDVYNQGRAIRYSDKYQPTGTNVNFVQMQENGIRVRTYERGVEDETLSCGTGVTACALAASVKGYHSPVKIQTPGGELSVEFKVGQQVAFHDIFLIGPAKKVFEGVLEL
ncbi:MAG: diaminopimelate epimerase [Cytophagales bacterium]